MQQIGYAQQMFKIGYRIRKRKKPQVFVAYDFASTPGGIRTPNPRFRRPMRYPIAPRAHDYVMHNYEQAWVLL